MPADRPPVEPRLDDRVREIVAEYWLDAESDNEDRALERLARALAATEAAADRDRLAAAAPPAEPEGLEVERLARAISSANAGIPSPYRAGAAAIAAEYDRLAPSVPPADAGEGLARSGDAAAGLDEAWEALRQDVVWPPGTDRSASDAFARHRPAIEAAVLRAADRVYVGCPVCGGQYSDMAGHVEHAHPSRSPE